MHELSIAASMLDLLAEELDGPRRLESVTVVIGPLSGVCADALAFCLPEIAEERGFGRPELLAEEVPARMRCAACQTEYPAADAFTLCPACGALERTVLSGEEFRLESVELEDCDVRQ